jgi:hypothetical protein
VTQFVRYRVVPDHESTLPKGEMTDTSKHYQNMRTKRIARLWESVFKEPGRIAMYFVDIYAIFAGKQ